MTTRMRVLDTEIWPRDKRTPFRDEIIDFFATFGIELMQKAQLNYEQYCKRNPTPPARSQPSQADAAERERYEARRGKMEQFRK